MTPTPLHPRPLSRHPDTQVPPCDPVVVRALYWIDMRTRKEGGLFTGWPKGATEVICADPPRFSGDTVAGWWFRNVVEDSYWLGAGNVIVCGFRVDEVWAA